MYEVRNFFAVIISALVSDMMDHKSKIVEAILFECLGKIVLTEIRRGERDKKT